MVEEPLYQPTRRPLPAWLLSSVFHLACLLLLAAFLNDSGPAGDEEPDRPVSIVLAERDSRDVTSPHPDRTNSDPPAQFDTNSLPSTQSMAAALSLDLALPDPADLSQINVGNVSTPRTTGSVSSKIPSNIDMSSMMAEEAERRRRQAALGPATTLELFGAPSAGRKFVFLIDRSKSMGGQGLGALAAAEQELVTSLSTLEPNHLFQVIVYHHKSVYLLARRLLRATPDNLAAVKGYLSRLASFGATDHERAIRSALYLEPDAIYLLTDGGDPVLSAAQLKVIQRSTAGRITINCIQFGYGPQGDEDNFLSRLAAQNGGGYRYVDMSTRRRP